MNPVLVLYATCEGHTWLVAQHVSTTLRERGLPVVAINAKSVSQDLCLDQFTAAIVCASVHGGKHGPEIVRFVKRHLDDLVHMHNAFLSVSLSQAGVEDETATPERRRQAEADVKKMIDGFAEQT